MAVSNADRQRPYRERQKRASLRNGDGRALGVTQAVTEGETVTQHRNDGYPLCSDTPERTFEAAAQWFAQRYAVGQPFAQRADPVSRRFVRRDRAGTQAQWQFR